MSLENKIEVDTAATTQWYNIDQYVNWKTKHSLPKINGVVSPIITPLVMTPVCHSNISNSPKIEASSIINDLSYDDRYFDKRVIEVIGINKLRTLISQFFYNYNTYNAVTLGQLCWYIGISSTILHYEWYKKDFTGLKVLVNTNLFDTAFLNEPLEEIVFSHRLLIQDYIENKCTEPKDTLSSFPKKCHENYSNYYIEELMSELITVFNYSTFDSSMYRDINPRFKKIEGFMESFQNAMTSIKASPVIKTIPFFRLSSNRQSPGEMDLIMFILQHQYPSSSFSNPLSDFKESYKVMVL
jgi:hypothetical protein